MTKHVTLLFFLLQAGALAEDSRILLLNGGMDEPGNFMEFSQELKKWAEFMGGKPIVLDAAGRTSLGVASEPGKGFERDKEGLLVLRPTNPLPGALPATKERLKNSFSKMAKSKAEPGTSGNYLVFISDHGGPKGVCLQNGEDISGAELNQLKRELPSDKKVMTIHSHCYSESSMADPNREIPKDARELSAYFSKNFPKNRCSLGTSQVDEETNNFDAKEWEEFLKTKSGGRPSLDDIKKAMVESEKLTSSPSLTSDLFLKDLLTFICREALQKGSKSKSSETHQSSESTSGERPLAEKMDQICQDREAFASFIQADTNFRVSKQGIDYLRVNRSSAVAEYIYETDRSLSDHFFKKQEEIETLRAKWAADKAKGIPSDPVQEAMAVTALQDSDYKEYKRKFSSWATNYEPDTKFGNYYRNNFPVPVPEAEEDQGRLLFKTLMGIPESPENTLLKSSRVSKKTIPYDPLQLEWMLLDLHSRTQKDRKYAAGVFDQIRAGFGMELMKKHPFLKELYDNIRECEKTPLG